MIYFFAFNTTLDTCTYCKVTYLVDFSNGGFVVLLSQIVDCKANLSQCQGQRVHTSAHGERDSKQRLSVN